MTRIIERSSSTNGGNGSRVLGRLFPRRNGRGEGRPRVLHVATADSTVRFMLAGQLQMIERAGYEVAAMSAPGPWVAEIEAAGIPFIPWPHATRRWAPGDDVRAYRELRALLHHEPFDVVHTHNPKPGVLGRIAARAAGVPAVVNTVHGFYTQPGERSVRKRVFLGAEYLAARLSDFELFQSAEDLAWARRIGIVGPERSGYLGNGCDLSRFDRDRVDAAAVRRLRDEWRIPDGAPVVGMVGRLVREKGWPEFLEAARLVRETHPDAVFLAIGPADEDKDDALRPAEIERAGVRATGMTLEMPAALSILDVFVLASHREGFPRSAVEAAAIGAPLVLTDIRGCREVARDGEEGFLVPVRSPRDLAAAIGRLLGDARLRTRMGRAAGARARREFDEREVVRRTLLVYDALLDGGRAQLGARAARWSA